MMSTKWPRNFLRHEFEHSETAVRYNIDNTIPKDLLPHAYRLARWLQVLRDRLSVAHGHEVPVYISSGYRCKRLNRKLRASKTSAHMEALAADIHAVGLSPTKLFAFIREEMGDIGWDQVILEHKRWVHVGLSDPQAFQRGEELIAYKAGRKTLYRWAD